MAVLLALSAAVMVVGAAFGRWDAALAGAVSFTIFAYALLREDAR